MYFCSINFKTHWNLFLENYLKRYDIFHKFDVYDSGHGYFKQSIIWLEFLQQNNKELRSQKSVLWCIYYMANVENVRSLKWSLAKHLRKNITLWRRLPLRQHVEKPLGCHNYSECTFICCRLGYVWNINCWTSRRIRTGWNFLQWTITLLNCLFWIKIMLRVGQVQQVVYLNDFSNTHFVTSLFYPLLIYLPLDVTKGWNVFQCNIPLCDSI